MSYKYILASLLAAFLLASCATQKELVKPEEPQETLAQEDFRLPDVPPLEEEKMKQQETKRLEQVLLEGQEDEKYILLNFENADISTVIATFGELLDINYILTPGISGSVTIQSYNKFPVKNLFQIFQSILELNGLTAIKDGDFYKIIPIDMARQQPLDVEKGQEVEVSLDPTFVTQLIPLQQVKATDISNVLRSLMPRGTDIIVYEPANMLIVTALPGTLTKFMNIVNAIDVVGSDSEVVRTFVYNVENGEAKKLEEILKAIYDSPGGSSSSAPSGTTTTAVAARTRRTAPTPPQAAAGSLPAEIGEVSITAYEDINALIIKCSTRDYLSLLEVLKLIDVPPKQVVIEVVIAEIQLTDSLRFGLEWLLKTGRGDLFSLDFGNGTFSDTSLPDTLPNRPTGLAGVVSGSRGDDLYTYVFSTLASETNVNVLASPLVLALDNQEAEIKIGSEVPTATSTTQSSTEGGTFSSQIQYKTVGTILTVTPHITDKGNVNMKIVVESSDIGLSTTIGQGSYPSFTTRRATTSAVVEDAHTLFLGGLISEKKSNSSDGIPFLSRIPIIGLLFGSHNKANTRTELIIMVTPHVVSDQVDADRISTEFQHRVKTIRDTLKHMKNNPLEIPEKEEDQEGDEKTEADQEKT